MQRTTKLNSINKYLTEDEWIGKLKKWRESTTTSPSKLHLGHHKSLIYPFDDTDKINKEEKRWDFLIELEKKIDDKNFNPYNHPTESDSDTDSSSTQSSTTETTLEHMRKALLGAQLMLMNYAIKHEYVYKRWRSVVNMMILKEEGNTKINRLRVIHLYEADYNLLLGVK